MGIRLRIYKVQDEDSISLGSDDLIFALLSYHDSNVIDYDRDTFFVSHDALKLISDMYEADTLNELLTDDFIEAFEGIGNTFDRDDALIKLKEWAESIKDFIKDDETSSFLVYNY